MSAADATAGATAPPVPADSQVREPPPVPTDSLPVEAPPVPTDSLSPRAALAGVLALIALVHAPLLDFGFVYDDGWTLVTNGFLRVPGDLGALLSSAAVERNVPDAFRPGLVVFDALTYQLFGLRAGLHHALSIALHLGVCAALAAWLRRLAAPTLLSVGTAALFGLLAVHAEAVAVVSYREDLLAALLGLLAARAASDALDLAGGPRAMRLGLAALLSFGACSMKLSAGAMPLLWLLAEALSPWRPRRPARALATGALALAAGVLGVVAYTVALYGSLDPYGAGNLRVHASRVGLGPVLAASLQIHLGYLQQIVLPVGLSPEYTDRGAAWTEPATLLAGAGLLSLLVYGLAVARRRPVAALAILGAVALALPTSNLFAMPNMRADRFTYLPSAAACLGIAAALLAAGRRLADQAAPSARAALLIAPLAVVCVVQGSLRVAAAFAYRNNTQLWAVARQRAPDSARAQAIAGELIAQNLAEDAPEAQKSLTLARAEAHCELAERLDPLYELPQLCFARLAAARQDWAEAYRRFARAKTLSPDRNARILAALAEVSLDLPGTSEAARRRTAERHLAEGLAAYPYSPELRAAAGRVFHRVGEPEKALEHYAAALRLAPERAEALLWSVELLLDTGRPVEATALIVAEKTAWLAADPRDRTALTARHRDALRLFAPSMILSADPVGVFRP